jgi:flagellin-like protein
MKNSFRIFRRRKGLTEVVTVLILVAFSVLLALTAIVYTNGVTRSRMKSTAQEDVRYHKEHAWIETFANGTDRAVVAFKLHNLGGKSISIQTIDLRGSEMDWSDVYHHVINKTSESMLLYSELYHFDWGSLVGQSVIIDGYNFTKASGSVWVNPGDTVIVYIQAPSIMFKDNIGQPITLAVSTIYANYITEIVVEHAG